jgi:glycosyltransferase involved in cell wall biosynthesis
MHILFVHQNYPAQFGHIARYLVRERGFQCSFATQKDVPIDDGVRRIVYQVRGGATAQTHYCSRSFENYTWHTHAVYEALKAHPDIRPDLIVGHSGFGSTLFLPELYSCPIINYFEYYYHAHDSDMDFRPEFPSNELNMLRARSRNAMLLLDLQNCTAGYSPTQWQRSLFPTEYQPKLESIFDGVDTDVWRPLREEERGPRQFGNREIPAHAKIVTYVSRGFESMRGFDIFMRIAKGIYQSRDDVVFVCVGTDNICYGGDQNHIQAKTFRQHVLVQDQYDLERFVFTGPVPPTELARILSHSDLHIYLTVPFVLSWSLMNALACGCTVLASNTPPVREMVQDGDNGLLADFYDVDRFVERTLAVLADPGAFAHLGQAGVEMIQDRYSLTRVLPQMLALYERVLAQG